MPVRIVEGQLPYTGGTGIEIDANKVISLLLREENNLILVNDDNEIYTDLQLASGLTPQSDFPVGVTTGKVLEGDGRPQSGLMLNWKTTSGDYARWIYCADGEIYFDGGNGVWRKVYYSSEVDALLQQLRNYVDLNFQPKLTAGAGITIDANNVISAQGAGTGDVSGPNSAVNGNVTVFDGTTGKAIKDGGVSLSTLSAGASAGATAVQPGDIGTAAYCNTGTSSGNVPILDSNGHLVTSTLPGVALTDTFTVSTTADLITLSSADQGDIAIVTTENKTYVLSQAPYSTAANWKEILAPTGGVTSVNGSTGAVTVSEFTASNGGTKVFTYPTTSVEDIVTWCNGGGTAILKKSDGPYVVSKVGTNYITSVRDNSGDGGTFGTGSVYVDMLTYNNNTYALTSSNNVATYNYFQPGGTATTGYVVTKTANGYEWSAPTAAPVTSVNNQTGAVTVLESQTKVFSMPEVGDNISDLVSWLSAGKSAVLFEGDDTQGDRDGFYYNVIYFYESNGQIECISEDIGDSQVLEYRILYDNLYEVFTKEQNIRLLAPNGGTNGQVLTQGGNGIPTWQNPSGGDVVVSSQTGNILQSGMKIWAGEETDYANLGTYDNNTLYLTVPDSN